MIILAWKHLLEGLCEQTCNVHCILILSYTLISMFMILFFGFNKAISMSMLIRYKIQILIIQF